MLPNAQAKGPWKPCSLCSFFNQQINEYSLKEFARHYIGVTYKTEISCGEDKFVWSFISIECIPHQEAAAAC